ncbi:hypothetical protein ACFONL_03800 [Camelimonas fluminis]|uniref:Uncharacterized protein n=1 Tax=Camelimonas fluminis TaxID=1576911 RepID=A0ABV7UD14_9HYPH|nr:hypothetical protein [Camelimonas fluminis]
MGALGPMTNLCVSGLLAPAVEGIAARYDSLATRADAMQRRGYHEDVWLIVVFIYNICHKNVIIWKIIPITKTFMFQILDCAILNGRHHPGASLLLLDWPWLAFGKIQNSGAFGEKILMMAIRNVAKSAEEGAGNVAELRRDCVGVAAWPHI